MLKNYSTVSEFTATFYHQRDIYQSVMVKPLRNAIIGRCAESIER
ncbi:hypothetical protein THIOSC15_3610002 [uncultured Thiomicrorhabdus sp.]